MSQTQEEKRAERDQKRLAALANASQFSGSMEFHRYMMNCLLTEGTKYICEMCECFWFADVIASYQGEKWARENPFQVWKLEVEIERGFGKVTCEDGNDNVLVTQDINNTDFPARELTFWAERNEMGGMTILLPSEH
jgi:hypothetical protein